MATTLRVAQFFSHDNASPAGMRDRSKVKKTVPAQVPLGTSNRDSRFNLITLKIDIVN